MEVRTPETPETVERRRGRPRSPRTHRAIIDATLELLEGQGYEATTIEGIAARAGVGKQTIYRWWPTRAALVMEAYEARVVTRTLEPDTGTLRRDLCLTLLYSADVFRTTAAAGIVTRLAAESHLDRDLRDAFQRFMENRRALLRRILERARDRGELTPDADLDLLVDLLYGTLLFRALLSGGPLDQAHVEQLADAVLPRLTSPPPAG